MQPEPVEQALAAVSEDDTPKNRARLFQLLLRTELLVPAVEEPEEELVRMTEEGEELDILYLEPGVMAVYIDVAHLLESVPEGCGYIGMSGRDLFRLAADNAVTRVEVNPASDTRCTIERWEVEALTRADS